MNKTLWVGAEIWLISFSQPDWSKIVSIQDVEILILDEMKKTNKKNILVLQTHLIFHQSSIYWAKNKSLIQSKVVEIFLFYAHKLFKTVGNTIFDLLLKSIFHQKLPNSANLKL